MCCRYLPYSIHTLSRSLSLSLSLSHTHKHAQIYTNRDQHLFPWTTFAPGSRLSGRKFHLVQNIVEDTFFSSRHHWLENQMKWLANFNVSTDVSLRKCDHTNFFINRRMPVTSFLRA